MRFFQCEGQVLLGEGLVVVCCAHRFGEAVHLRRVCAFLSGTALRSRGAGFRWCAGVVYRVDS